jgi:hypothetical protein
MEDHIKGLAAQGFALIEQSAGPGADPWIAGHVSRRRHQIGQHKLGERLA